LSFNRVELPIDALYEFKKIEQNLSMHFSPAEHLIFHRRYMQL